MSTASDADTAESKRRERWWLVAIVLVALFLRLWPAGHGMPRKYVPDDHVVRNALGMAKDKDLVPPAGKYSTYPYLVPYTLLPVYAARYAAGRAAGEWSGAEEFGYRVMERPGIVQVPARIVMGLFGALSAVAAFAAARAAGLRRGALVAAWLAATCLLNVQLSTHARPWTAVVLFMGLALVFAVRYASKGKPLDLMLSGVLAGLAVASHQAGLAALAVPFAGWAFSPLFWRGEDLKRRLGHGLACCALFLAAAVVVGNPYYLLYGATDPGAVVGGERAADKFSIGGQAVQLGVSLASAKRLSVALFGYDPVLVVLGMAGAAAALFLKPFRAVLLSGTLIGGFFLTNPSDHVRYLLPLAFFLTLTAGLLGERLLASRAGAALLALLCAVPLVQALRFDVLMRRPDTRALAEQALAELPRGSLTVIDHYGPLPDLNIAALQRIHGLRELYAREAYRAERLQVGLVPVEEQGVDAIRAEDLFEVDHETHAYGVRELSLDLGQTPAEVIHGLGATHLLVVDRGRGSELGDVAGSGTVVRTIDPAGLDGSPPSEAWLPTEMDFTLTALWAVERPGPWMQLIELRDARE